MNISQRLLTLTEESSFSIYIAWYEISHDHFHPYATRWIENGDQENLGKANAYGQKHYGRDFLVMKMNPSDDNAKNKALQEIIHKAQSEHPELNLAPQFNPGK